MKQGYIKPGKGLHMDKEYHNNHIDFFAEDVRAAINMLNTYAEVIGESDDLLTAIRALENIKPRDYI